MMISCPRCHQSIDSQAVRCPYCSTVLKAYGHPGIPLHQAEEGRYLCDSCVYHEDDSCNFPQRPYATSCTLYRDKSEPVVGELKSPLYPASFWGRFKTWCRRNRGWLLLLGLIVVSVLLALG
jgi:Double zinc ribbon